MRIWHQDLISKLPDVKTTGNRKLNQLGGQWTELRMILGSIRKNGKVNHSTVNYVNNHSISHIRAYGLHLANEMMSRGFNLSPLILEEYMDDNEAYKIYLSNKTIFPEHNDRYMVECIENLLQKGIDIR